MVQWFGLLPGHPCPMWALVFSSGFHFWYGFLLMCLGNSRKWSTSLATSQPNGSARWSSWSLALTLPSLSTCAVWEVDQWIQYTSVYFCLSNMFLKYFKNINISKTDLQAVLNTCKFKFRSTDLWLCMLKCTSVLIEERLEKEKRKIAN